ncbi:MAG: hypothetical protein HN411_02930 [Waddliaceae bacterium]|jgi:putative tryptophan/tyrosine transport system substrate-binding protein|nr:hypothetical protein [Waddliaceae bacterium]MBT3578632.1 hypothetical protein [Waddliaceae bacterium]MBT4445351.1 hypothetical protein [Waddliaceae bacterium]MBT6928381.1 hypothetical protein [Waddliaceae bacterium]MBT7265067.1 hypothetical protein [Waddliaceae bacterium]
MKKYYYIIAIAVAITSYAIYTTSLTKDHRQVVGVVVPMPHVAMDEIVAGVYEALDDDDINIVVQNAYGEAEMQRSIIQQFIDNKVDVIAPIGTDATLMALKMSDDIPVVGLASYAVEEQENYSPEKFSVILDEISLATQLNFIKKAVVDIRHLTIVYSASLKAYNDAHEFSFVAKDAGIEVQGLMVQSLADMYAISNAIDSKTDAIVILKDHLVVSACGTLAQKAAQLGVPLITSDLGSIATGGAFALAVEEKDIGVIGGQQIKKILKGESEDLEAVVVLEDLKVFINTAACKAQGIDSDAIATCAKKEGYHDIIVDSEGESHG